MYSRRTYLCARFFNIDAMNKQEYESPVIETITTEMNGIICQSGPVKSCAGGFFTFCGYDEDIDDDR